MPQCPLAQRVLESVAKSFNDDREDRSNFCLGACWLFLHNLISCFPWQCQRIDQWGILSPVLFFHNARPLETEASQAHCRLSRNLLPGVELGGFDIHVHAIFHVLEEHNVPLTGEFVVVDHPQNFEKLLVVCPAVRSGVVRMIL